MYNNPRLIELLEKQHQSRNQSDLFKKGQFVLQWRAKVGSFPHPDVETLVSAGEPCGAWSIKRPEEKRNVGQNLEQLPELPLNGYIPGSAIRGLVRSWANKRPEVKPRMLELLGYQDSDIHAGKIQFLDAWPIKATPLTLDIVNPQEKFQVYHISQSTPLSFYTFGNGEEPVEITIAIRGIPRKATKQDVEEVWGWVQQALTFYGVGSRTASGYGVIKPTDKVKPTADPNYATRLFKFTLYSQGSYGVDPKNDPELRPSHWRGWLRSWILRFLLGVMAEEKAQLTLAELMGSLEPKSFQGKVRLKMERGENWGQASENLPRFYVWEGSLSLSAPQKILQEIILPIVKFAVSVGGVGRGWRRPLHIFRNDKEVETSRGTHLKLTHKAKKKGEDTYKDVPFNLPLKPDRWHQAYQEWRDAVSKHWPERVTLGYNNPVAEVFCPESCAVYVVPGPVDEPIDDSSVEWQETSPEDKRGDGINLIYQPHYKRKNDVGGNAGSGGSSCSWVSIKRVNIQHQDYDTNCQEIVCLFLGGGDSHLRVRFLNELAQIPGAVLLFGVNPPQP